MTNDKCGIVIDIMNNQVFRDYKRSLALLPIVKVMPWLVSNAFSVVGLTFIQVFGMRFFVYELVQKRTFRELWWLFLAYAVVAVVLYLAKTWSTLKVYPIFTNVRTEQMAKIADHILTMDLKYYEDQSFLTQAFSALSCLSSNDTGLEGIYRKSFLLAGASLNLILLLVILSQLRWWLPGIFLSVLFVQYLLANKQSAFEDVIREELQGENRKLNRYTDVAANFAYGKDIRIFSYAKQMGTAMTDTLGRIIKIFNMRFRHENAYLWLSVFLMAVPASLCLYYIFVSYQQSLSPDYVIFYISALALVTRQVSLITSYLSFISRELRNVAAHYVFLDLKLVEEDAGRRVRFESAPVIEFENVSFKYPNAEKNIFTDLCLKIEAGEKIALVGINGAGKTTLIKLLSGLYRPDYGKILIDGIDYTSFSVEDLRDLVAVVFQEIEAVSGTVAENVAASLEAIDRERVIWALRKAGLLERIQDAKSGIDSIVLKVEDSEGLILSGGELQKLMVARALYKNKSKILILDEPTASLDAMAEEKLYLEFSELMNGMTSIFISHRLASVRFCDRIVLMDGGEIKETGTHAELLVAGGLYSEMFEAQTRAYQEKAQGSKEKN